MQKLIIEVRVNEYASRDENPNVPWTADEIARDAAAIAEAGASILHFHARKPDGSPAHDVEDYATVIRGIRNATDLLVHPTLGQITVSGDEERMAHIRILAEDPMLRPDLAPIDMGSTNLDAYDSASKRFATSDRTYVNRTGSLVHLAGTLKALGIAPAVACWSAPFVRTMDAFFDMGLLPDPTYALLLHTGGTVYGGHPPTADGLRAYLDFLPPGRNIVWSVASKPGNLFAVAAQSIQLGGHVAIGIGDHSYCELGAPTNAGLVRRVVQLAESCGREVATPQEARVLLNLA